MNMVSAWLTYGDDWPILRDEFVSAANVIRGGRPDDDAGHAYRLATDLTFQETWMRRRSAEDAARWIMDRFAGLFGEVFVTLEPATFAPQLAAMRNADANEISLCRGRGLVGTDLIDRIQPRREKNAIVLVREIVWAAFVVAEKQRRAADREYFRFPMPGRATRKTAGSQAAGQSKRRLHQVLLAARSERARRAAARSRSG
jgi:hypothetical protein